MGFWLAAYGLIAHFIDQSGIFHWRFQLPRFPNWPEGAWAWSSLLLLEECFFNPLLVFYGEFALVRRVLVWRWKLWDERGTKERQFAWVGTNFSWTDFQSILEATFGDSGNLVYRAGIGEEMSQRGLFSPKLRLFTVFWPIGGSLGDFCKSYFPIFLQVLRVFFPARILGGPVVGICTLFGSFDLFLFWASYSK